MAYRRSALESRMVQLRFDGAKRKTVSAPKIDFPYEEDDSAETTGDIPIGPPEGPSADQVRVQLESPDWEKDDSEEQERLEFQFTLKQLMLVMLVACISFSALQFMSPSAYAGVAGMMALLGMVVLALGGPATPAVYVCWLAVLGVYLIASMIAAIAG